MFKSKETTGAGSGLAAAVSFKTRIEEDDELDEDVGGCCIVSESGNIIKHLLIIAFSIVQIKINIFHEYDVDFRI